MRMIRVDLHAGQRVFEGWGTSLAWWANAVGRMPRAQRNAVVRRIFGLDAGGLGMTVARFNAGGGESPAVDVTMQSRAVMEGYRTSPIADLDESADPGQRAVLREAARTVAESGGGLVVELFGNSPPWWATVSGSVTGASSAPRCPAPNLSPVFANDYLKYLADVAGFIERDSGIRVASISPFNEPTSRWWVLGGRQEGCHFTTGGIDRLLTALSVKPDVFKGRLIAASEEWSLEQAVETWDALGPSARRTIDRLNVHTYDGQSRAAVRARAARAGIDLWVSEFGEGDETGLGLALAIVHDLRELAPRAWVLWQVVSPDAWGALRLARDGATVAETLKFEVLARFTRSIRPGMRLVGTDDPFSVAAAAPDRCSVVVVGDAELHERVGVDFGEGAVSDVEVIVVDAGGKGQIARHPVEPEDGVIRFRLPAGAIASVTAQVIADPDDGRFWGSGTWWLEHESGTRLGLAGSGDSELRAGVRVAGVTPDAASLAQRWRAEACGDGSTRWVCEASGHQLDIERASQRSGAHAIQWPAGLAEKAPAHARFEVVESGERGVMLVARHSGRALALDQRGFGAQRAPGDWGTHWRLVRASNLTP